MRTLLVCVAVVTASFPDAARALDVPVIFAALTGQAGFMCYLEPKPVEGCDDDLICDQNRRCRELWYLTLSALAVSQAAYEEDQSTRSAYLGDVGFIERAYRGDSWGYDAEAVIATSPEVIVVGIAGTESAGDVLTDARAILVDPNDVYDAGWLGCTLADWDDRCPVFHQRMHEGFLAYAHDLWSFVKDEVLAAREEKMRPVQFVGHSLGGAVAQLLAARFAVNLNMNVDAVVTFGSPKIGDDGWRAAYENVLNRATYRWVNDRDAVPNLPTGEEWRRSGQQHYIHQEIGSDWSPYWWYELDSPDYQLSVSERDWGDHDLSDGYLPVIESLVPCGHPLGEACE